jgi:quinol monooxygenase YgiN
MYIVYINFNMEKEMKKLLDLGFKKVPTEDGFHMYELTPAALKPKREEWNHEGDTWTHPDGRRLTRKPQVTSGKPQAASNKRIDKVK